MWIDSHCHLNHPRIEDLGSPLDIALNAFSEQTDALVSICCRISEETEQLQQIAASHDNIWCTIGTHPHDAGLDAEKSYSSDDIAKIVMSNNKVIGIGETGLDYYYEKSPVQDQKNSFIKHLKACVKADVPVIIHSRDADDDTADIIEQEYKSSNGKLRGLLHCFSSGEQLAMRALDIGFYVSFSGILTFKKSDDLRAIAKKIPADRLLIETDAPFLAPQQFRGKTNTPAYVRHVGEMLACIFEIPTEDMAKITSDNFYRLFTKASQA